MTRVRNDQCGSLLPSLVGRPVQRCGIVGQSRAVADLIRRIDLVAATRSTVLITGETGTGKELVARAVHDCSAQKNLPFSIRISSTAFCRWPWRGRLRF